MTTVTNIRALAPALPDVVGYVEACTGDRILGWAWSPGNPELRTRIELRVGDVIVANASADLPRADLASNGIGDGQHAFDITIPVDMRNRAAELRVFAQAGQGEPRPIGAPPAADNLSDQVSRMLRGVDTLLNSQRVIHRSLQTALAAANASSGDSAKLMLDRLVERQTETEVQLSAVERFVVRLDEHLARLSPGDLAATTPAVAMPRPAAWAFGIAVAALCISIIGLYRSLGG